METTYKNFALTKTLVLILAAAGGITVANIYYAQPLLSEIARAFHVSQGDIGIVVMLHRWGMLQECFLYCL
jgi:predicted MFS family arabinose efflux permease